MPSYFSQLGKFIKSLLEIQVYNVNWITVTHIFVDLLKDQKIGKIIFSLYESHVGSQRMKGSFFDVILALITLSTIPPRIQIKLLRCKLWFLHESFLKKIGIILTAFQFPSREADFSDKLHISIRKSAISHWNSLSTSGVYHPDMMVCSQ